MDEQQNIQPMQSDFEQIKKTDADGKDFWSARERRTRIFPWLTSTDHA